MSCENAFDELIHAPNRLQLCAMLAPVHELSFATARETVGVSDSVLSKHVKVLQNAGYVKVCKAIRGSQRYTELSLTSRGRRALAGHLNELRRIERLAASVPDSSLATADS